MKREQASEPHLADMLELSHQEFKMTMINMLKVLMDKVDCIQEQMDILSSKTKKRRKQRLEKNRAEYPRIVETNYEKHNIFLSA